MPLSLINIPLSSQCPSPDQCLSLQSVPLPDQYPLLQSLPLPLISVPSSSHCPPISIPSSSHYPSP